MNHNARIQAQGQRLNLPLVGPTCGKRRYYIKSEADGHRAALERLDQARGLTKLGPVAT
jgi:hypothetical protein